jgi:hypothetical protein
MDKYINLLKKAESGRIEKRVKVAHFEIINKEYEAYISYLKDYNKKIEDLTGDTEMNPAINNLLDQMRLTVFAHDYEHNFLPNNKISSAAFRDWCGAGTDILKNVELDNDFSAHYKIDEICKEHDYAYSNARTKEDLLNADKEMLKAIMDNYGISDLLGTKERLHDDTSLKTADDWYQYLIRHVQNTYLNFIKASATIGTASYGAKKIFYEPINNIYNFAQSVRHAGVPFLFSDINMSLMKYLMTPKQSNYFYTNSPDYYNDYSVAMRKYTNILLKDIPLQIAKTGAGMAFTHYSSAVFKDMGYTMGASFIIGLKYLFGLQIVGLNKHIYDPTSVKSIIDTYYDLQKQRVYNSTGSEQMPPFLIPDFYNKEVKMDDKFSQAYYSMLSDDEINILAEPVFSQKYVYDNLIEQVKIDVGLPDDYFEAFLKPTQDLISPPDMDPSGMKPDTLQIPYNEIIEIPETEALPTPAPDTSTALVYVDTGLPDNYFEQFL